MTNPDFRTLLDTVALRNEHSEAAMAQLYGALHGSVFAFVRRRWGAADDHLVQAVVVDTLYEVWRSAGKFGGDSLVKTWVLGIARHKLLDAARQLRQAPPEEDVADHAETLEDPAADIWDRLVEKQRIEWVACCMDKLPAEQRESLHLLLVEGLGVGEIARIQGCPAGTVKSRVFHAKQKLKECVADWLRQESAEPVRQADETPLARVAE